MIYRPVLDLQGGAYSVGLSNIRLDSFCSASDDLRVEICAKPQVFNGPTNRSMLSIQ